MKKNDIESKFRFNDYQKETINRFIHILESNPKGACDEQGLPSYTIKNPAMRWLTWTRVKIVLSYLEKISPFEFALDFGCGYGVFLPYLVKHSRFTSAVDVIYKEVEQVGIENNWENIEYLGSLSEILFYKKKYNVILAIEVLEHIDNLEEVAKNFAEILDSTNGHLIVSGPTENWLYKIGRKLAGFSGEYHMRNIYDIRSVLQKSFKVKRIATLVPLIPFYEIYDCQLLDK